MIIDIPNKEDFFSSADDMVNEAWEKTIALASKYYDIINNIDFYKSMGISIEQHIIEREEYWPKERPRLISALTLILQSVEFRLKGMIVEISPYLLLSSSSKNIPQPDSNGVISFAQFRSIDAQDLIKVYETFSNNKLSPKFKKWYEEIRILRNRFMHTVDKTSDIKPEIIFKSIVLTHQELNPKDTNWLQKRVKYLGGIDNKDLTDDKLGELTLNVQNELFFGVYVCSMEIVNELFNYDKNKEGSYCIRCLETMKKYEYFGEEWLKYCLETVQKNKRTNKNKCIFCDFE